VPQSAKILGEARKKWKRGRRRRIFESGRKRRNRVRELVRLVAEW
jgi:hypothetical protein